jgi:hypothetical protein
VTCRPAQLVVAIAGTLAAGCVQPFQGSNVQFDFSPTMLVQASAGAMPGSGELPHDVHFTFYAIEDGDNGSGSAVESMFAVTQFEVHRIVDLTSPCFIDVGAHVPYPGLHVSQYANVIEQATGITNPAAPPAGTTQAEEVEVATAIQRMTDIGLLEGPTGIKVVTSTSSASYPPLATNCTDESGIPPPTCTDSASNARRLAMCQAMWKANPDYYEGTDRVLTAPLNGTDDGDVDGLDPINDAPVGGAQFFANTELAGVDAYAVYWQVDGMPDPGNLLLYGTPTMPTQGVYHVAMTSPTTPGITAAVAIFANLDANNSSF